MTVSFGISEDTRSVQLQWKTVKLSTIFYSWGLAGENLEILKFKNTWNFDSNIKKYTGMDTDCIYLPLGKAVNIQWKLNIFFFTFYWFWSQLVVK